MDQTQAFFLMTLRSHVTGDAELCADGVDWTAFCRLCLAHQVGGIVLAALEAARFPTPEEARRTLRGSYLAGVCISARQSDCYEELSLCLEES